MLPQLTTAGETNGCMTICLEGCNTLWLLDDVMSDTTSSEQPSDSRIEGCVVEGDEGGIDVDLIVSLASFWWRRNDRERGGRER
jgi:hypothetical protein